jgi:hypothetical protein
MLVAPSESMLCTFRLENTHKEKVYNSRFSLTHKEKLMFCPNCGSEVSDDSKFCKACGTRLGGTVTEEFSVAAGDTMKKVQELLHEGNITRIIVKDEAGRLLLEIPATVGVVGAILAPWMAALGVVAAIATRCTIVVERRV